MARTKLIDRMVANAELNGKDGLYTRLKSKLPRQFGVKQADRLLMVRRTIVSPTGVKTKTDSLINCLHVSQVQRNLIGLSLGGAGMDGIQVQATDWQISGVPRSYPREWLQNDVEWFYLDPAIDEAGNIVLDASDRPTGGHYLKLLLLQDQPKKYLSWELIMREYFDNKPSLAGETILEMTY